MPDIKNGPNSNVPRPTETGDGTQKLVGNQLFDIEIIFDNHLQNEYVLPTHAILELVIEDDLLKWPYRGYLTYKNINEGLERSKEIDGKPFYIYRMDARDELKLSIKTNSEEDLPKDIWYMDFDMVIYDTEDLPSGNTTEKVKRVYFHDKRYQIMMDKKIQWSTATTGHNINIQGPPSLASDEDRSMLTGEAIKALLSDAGFADSIDEDNWDLGVSTTFYTSPANSSVAEDLTQLLKRHVCTGGDFSLFKIDRGSGKWQLKSAQSFFDQAGKTPDSPGPLQIEHLFFEDPNGDAGNTTPFKAPIGKDESKGLELDIKSSEWGKITTYEFVDMSGLDNSKTLISKPVNWYDPSKKQFGVDYEDNEVENVKDKFKEFYTDKLYPQNGASPLFTLNQTKTNQYNIENEFCYATVGCGINKITRLSHGMSKTLFSGLFLNECIHLRLIGSPHRLAGKFIAIDRMNGDDNEFDKKLCGQWFVVDVKHIWQHTKYVNDVLAVKVHSYQEIQINEEIE